jgi:DNA-binding HxlR family transcriptional regulator
MRSYGQFCPVAKAAEVFCQRWTPLILRDLAGGATRFSQLQRGVAMASPSLLTSRLRELEAEGIIERRKSESGSSWTYHLTEAGAEFVPLVVALGEWGQRWSRRELAAHEVNLELMLWAIESHAHPEAFGPDRTVIEFVFADQPEAKRRWWYINENGACEMCVKEPGFEVDLYIETELPHMIRVWRGDVALKRALAEGWIVPHGKTRLTRALPRWLGVSTLAHVKPARATVEA